MNPSRAQKRKEQILKGVLPLFLTHSYDSIAIPQIEEATKTTRGTLYKYFRNKEDIFQQAINQFYDSPLNVLYALPPHKCNLQGYWTHKIQQLQMASKYFMEYGMFGDLVAYVNYVEIESVRIIPSFKEIIKENRLNNITYWERVLEKSEYLGDQDNLNIKELAEIYNALFIYKCSNYPNCDLSLPKITIEKNKSEKEVIG